MPRPPGAALAGGPFPIPIFVTAMQWDQSDSIWLTGRIRLPWRLQPSDLEEIREGGRESGDRKRGGESGGEKGLGL